MTGRLIRQTRRMEVAYRLCRCGHEGRLHLELRRDDPDYRPLRFVCRQCGCDDNRAA